MRSGGRVLVVGMASFVLLGSACGGGASSRGADTVKVSTSTVEMKKDMSLADFVSSVGCTGYRQASEMAPFTVEWGYCSFDGGEVQAYVFPNHEALNSFFETVKAYGVIKEQAAIRGLFVLAPDDATKLAALKTAVGG